MTSEAVTIVTAFVDIGRDEWEGVINNVPIDAHIKRSVDTYFERFERLTKLNNPIICFTHSKYHDRILAMRDDITLVSIDNFFEENSTLLYQIYSIQQNPHFSNYVTRPSVPEYWSPGYVLVTSHKAAFCNYAVTNKLNTTDTVAWIDFGYCRPDTPITPGMTWKYKTDNLIHMVCNTTTPINKLPIYEIVRTGEVYIQGCHVIAPADKWRYMDEQFAVGLESLLNVGFTDDDQILFLMAYRNDPTQFKIHYVHPDSYWFMIFRDFQHD